MLTKREIATVRKGADRIAKDTSRVVRGDQFVSTVPYACEALGFGPLADKMKAFYDPPCPMDDDDKWGDLPYGGQKHGAFTIESQLQRELMLELFAHLKGKV